MKRVDLIKALEAAGRRMVRHGAEHGRYRKPATGVSQAVPRHREIGERLAHRILRLMDAGEADDDEPAN